MNRSMPGLPVHHQLLEFTQTPIHRVGDAIQSSHPLSSPSPPAPNPSQHQGLFQWVNSLHEVAKVLELGKCKSKPQWYTTSHLSEWLSSKRQQITSTGKDAEKRTFVNCWWDCKLAQPLWKTIWRFLKKLKIELPYYPAVSLLGIHPKKTKTLIWNNIHTTFTEALFAIAKI